MPQPQQGYAPMPQQVQQPQVQQPQVQQSQGTEFYGATIDPQTMAVVQQCYGAYQYGKPLKGSKADIWRYRVGNYRVLCQIENQLKELLAQ